MGHFINQFFQIKRFGYNSLATKRGVVNITIDVSRKYDYRNMAELSVGFELFANFAAIAIVKQKIKNNQIGVIVVRYLQNIIAGTGGVYIKILIRKNFINNF